MRIFFFNYRNYRKVLFRSINGGSVEIHVFRLFKNKKSLIPIFVQTDQRIVFRGSPLEKAKSTQINTSISPEPSSRKDAFVQTIWDTQDIGIQVLFSTIWNLGTIPIYLGYTGYWDSGIIPNYLGFRYYSHLFGIHRILEFS